MKENTFYITVEDIERRIIIQALSDLKDKQKMLGKNYDFIDSIIIKVCDSPKVKNKKAYEKG